ncbi:hypothetical protein JZ751_024919 [Albula glossodonta]|uniref:Uncharacterized protein n=1 Tax=Albula glossodonta TaxID=121402 RepID=A0A8T2PFX9_9TELE|nr:hypothetical protein JZ751_024919 [Albula glossodonta]
MAWFPAEGCLSAAFPPFPRHLRGCSSQFWGESSKDSDPSLPLSPGSRPSAVTGVTLRRLGFQAAKFLPGPGHSCESHQSSSKNKPSTAGEDECRRPCLFRIFNSFVYTEKTSNGETEVQQEIFAKPPYCAMRSQGTYGGSLISRVTCQGSANKAHLISAASVDEAVRPRPGPV